MARSIEQKRRSSLQHIANVVGRDRVCSWLRIGHPTYYRYVGGYRVYDDICRRLSPLIDGALAAVAFARFLKRARGL